MKRLLLFLPLFLLSCIDGDITNEDLLPDATGEHGHILILMEQNLWDGQMGEALQAQLDQRAKGVYLRPEPIFNYHQNLPGSLTHINKLSRIILKVFVDRDSTYQQTAVIEKHNYYAKGQLFLVIKDSDANRLLSYIKNDFGQALNIINDFELQTLVKQYKDRPNNTINEQAEKKFGFSISLPRDSELRVAEDNFMWVKYDRSHNIIGNQATGSKGGTFWVQEGIIFWSEPYSDSAMAPSHILEKRDTILKYNIPGKVEGSYMATEYDPCCAPIGTVTTYDGDECVIFQGLWKHDGRIGAAGGGPFLQYSIHNKKQNTVVTVCGYIYAPQFDKREHLRELEAMLNTIKMN